MRCCPVVSAPGPLRTILGSLGFALPVWNQAVLARVPKPTTHEKFEIDRLEMDRREYLRVAGGCAPLVTWGITVGCGRVVVAQPAGESDPMPLSPATQAPDATEAIHFYLWSITIAPPPTVEQASKLPSTVSWLHLALVESFEWAFSQWGKTVSWPWNVPWGCASLTWSRSARYCALRSTLEGWVQLGGHKRPPPVDPRKQ